MGSASLVPANDPTLLFTTAGMVPFKEFFSGVATPPSKRLSSIQKCIRTTDLEETGKTKRHLSFFEMLGNFSFGDYFKKEAIEFAWEYSTQHLKFEKDRIHISVHDSDDEAYRLWKDHIGVHPSHIVRLGDKDNFWGPAGETGACGPSSELYLDRGEQFGKDCKMGDDCERFLEYWNLVFNQFFKNEDKKFIPLAQTGIDTGAGLERIASLLQNVDSVYDTDELKNLRDDVARAYQKEYQDQWITPIRVITDHVRTLSFAMADGIFPGNESRGYILRRILRRALLFGKKMGQREPMLHYLVPSVTRLYSEFYPELSLNQQTTMQFIQSEEKRFLQTLDSGSERLEAVLQEATEKKAPVSGKDIFMLYDTFGFPPEMTLEMAGNRGLVARMDEFREEMQKQKERGRAAWKGASAAIPLDPRIPATVFTGYEKEKDASRILALYTSTQKLESISEREMQGNLYVIFESTPFYAESGGQVGDSGFIQTADGYAQVLDTQKMGHYHVHVVSKIEGKLSVGDVAQLEIDTEKRSMLRKNHSATHLLNAALRKTLGDHVRQSGSMVDPSYLRFDFTHPSGLSAEQIRQIEIDVNENIRKSHPVTTRVLPIEEARNTGALMTFGEKYGNIVRVIQMGTDTEKASVEFCGGTHVLSTGDIGAFLILKESSPGAGNRRIEARVHKEAAFVVNNKLDSLLENVSLLLSSPDMEKGTDKPYREQLSKIKDRLENLKKNSTLSPDLVRVWISLKELDEEYKNLESSIKKDAKKKSRETGKLDSGFVDAILNSKQKDKKTLVYYMQDQSMDFLKSAADVLRDKEKNLVFILFSSSGEKWSLVAASSRKMAEETGLNISASFKTLSQELGIPGGGGGRPEFLQASGPLTPDNGLEKMKEKINLFAERLIL